MPIGASSFFDSNYVALILEWVTILILVLYALFALLIVRQVSLMSSTLITPVSPILKAFSIVHAGFAIGFILLGFGLL